MQFALLTGENADNAHTLSDNLRTTITKSKVDVGEAACHKWPNQLSKKNRGAYCQT